MKKIILTSYILLCTIISHTQTLIWSEDFTNNGAGWNLNVVNGAEGTDPNFFTVSDNEGGGLSAGACGVAGNGNNTLHVTSVFNPNGGASYDAGGLCGIFTCPLTNRSAISPTFNASGYSGIVIQFKYIEFGQGTIDNATITVSNGMTSFTTDMAKTAVCTNGQGQWSSYTVNGPIGGFSGTANMTIAFNWVNNDDGIGTDPSFAVDDIQVLGTPTTSNTITTLALTTPIPNSNYCPCNTDTVDFVSNGTFNAGNIYTAQLSDTNGSFANPTVIGSLASTANSGSIPITIPCNALYGTSYRIRVISSNPNVIGSNNGTNITINAIPPLTITATPSNPVCPATPVTFTVSPSLPAGYTYQWYRATNPWGPWLLLSSSTTNSWSWAPPPGTVYYIKCKVINILCGTQDSTSAVQVIVSPNINIAISSIPANLNNVCLGDSIALCASSPTAVSWSWSGGINNCASFAPSTTGTYTVTATDANGCTKTSSITITVGPISVLINATPSLANVCSGSPLTLCASGANTYSWTGGVTNCTPFTNYVNGTTYTVTGSDANGCTATSSITVNVLPLPAITVAATPSNATVCSGSPLTLCASGANTYSWSGAINNCVPFPATWPGTYIVSGTDANGCTGTSSINVSILSLPFVSISTSPSNATICNGSPLTLCAAGGSVSYSWTGGAINCAPFFPSTSSTYTVTATGSNGCTTTSSIPVSVFNIPTLNVALTPNTNTICQGDPLTLCASGTGTSYSWSAGVVNCQPNTNLSSGVYTVTAANAGCNTSSTVAITVNPLLTPSINISASPVPVVVGQMTTFTASVGSATNYQINWYRGGSFMQSTFSPTNSISTICSSISDSICAVVIPSGCYSPDSAQSNCIKPSYPESVDDVSALGVLIYPNPTQGQLYIRNAQVIEAAELYAINGDMLQIVHNTSKQNDITLDLNRLSVGLYILKLKSEGNTYYQKVVKE